MNGQSVSIPIRKDFTFIFILVKPPARAQLNKILMLWLTQSYIFENKPTLLPLYFSFVDYLAKEPRAYCLSEGCSMACRPTDMKVSLVLGWK